MKLRGWHADGICKSTKLRELYAVLGSQILPYPTCFKYFNEIGIACL